MAVQQNPRFRRAAESLAVPLKISTVLNCGGPELPQPGHCFRMGVGGAAGGVMGDGGAVGNVFLVRLPERRTTRRVSSEVSIASSGSDDVTDLVGEELMLLTLLVSGGLPVGKSRAPPAVGRVS